MMSGKPNRHPFDSTPTSKMRPVLEVGLHEPAMPNSVPEFDHFAARTGVFPVFAEGTDPAREADDSSTRSAPTRESRVRR